MQLEDYFEFETFNTEFGPVERIRVKGHRIAIEHILEYYKTGSTPESILRDVYPSLSMEEIYATILYYLANRKKIDAYLRRSEEVADKFYQQHLRKGPSKIEMKIRALKKNKKRLKFQPNT